MRMWDDSSHTGFYWEMHIMVQRCGDLVLFSFCVIIFLYCVCALVILGPSTLF